MHSSAQMSLLQHCAQCKTEWCSCSDLEKRRKAQFSWACAAQGFFGCQHFSKANDYLKKEGLPPVDWQIDPIT